MKETERAPPNLAHSMFEESAACPPLAIEHTRVLQAIISARIVLQGAKESLGKVGGKSAAAQANLAVLQTSVLSAIKILDTVIQD